MKALLIAGGHVDIQWASGFVKQHRYDLIVAVDGGLSTANLLGCRPDIIVGDFDTVDSETLAQYDEKATIIRLKPEKDDTDSQYAMKLLIERSVTDVDILGGTGRRMDHTMVNIYNLQMAHDSGVRATMYDPYNKMYIIEGDVSLRRDETYGRYISFMQLTPAVKDVTLQGFKYNVEHYDFVMSGEYRAGCSNEFASDMATVHIGQGRLLVIEVSEDKDERDT